MDEIKLNGLTYRKHSVDWYLALLYLQNFTNIGSIMDDEEFSRMYHQMLWYVLKQVDYPKETVLSKYVVTETYKRK